MKKLVAITFTLLIITACNNAGKDSIEIADSTNKAIQDSALNENKVVVDEESASFLVRVASIAMSQSETIAIIKKESTDKSIIEYADVLLKGNSEIS